MEVFRRMKNVKRLLVAILTIAMLTAMAVPALGANGDGDLTAKVAEMANGDFNLVVQYVSGNNSIKAGFFEVLSADGKTVLLSSPKVTFSNKQGMYSFTIDQDIPANAVLRMTEDKGNKPVVVTGKFADGFTAHVHDFVLTVTATCLSGGYDKMICACGVDDGKTYGWRGALTHDFKTVNVTEPTCWSGGGEYVECVLCGITQVRNWQGALGHNYVGEVTKEATCTESGTETFSCSRDCGANSYTETIPALGHDYACTTTAPTCEGDGFITYTCSVCGDNYVSDKVDALGHDYVVTDVIPMTHNSDGYSVYTCTNCGDSYEGDIVEAVAYDWQVKEIVPPTCTKKGFTVYEDTFWNKTKKADWVDALGHDHVGVVTAPTCTVDGFTTNTCTRCGDEYVDAIVEALGHDYVGVVTPPTCTEKGFTTYTCFCGDKYVGEYADALGHSHVGVVTPPTCTEQGFTTHTCFCGDEYVDGYVDALGHEYVDVVTPSTCTEDGYTTYTCSACGDVQVNMEEGDAVEALGHTEAVEGVVTTPATHTKPGIMTYYCTVCGDELRTAVIDAQGHIEVELHRVTNTAPTYSGNGSNRTGSTTVSLEFKLSDGSVVTLQESFTGAYVDNKGGSANLTKTVTDELGCYKVTVEINLTYTGSQNSFAITGATAKITDSKLVTLDD